MKMGYKMELILVDGSTVTIYFDTEQERADTFQRLTENDNGCVQINKECAIPFRSIMLARIATDDSKRKRRR